MVLGALWLAPACSWLSPLCLAASAGEQNVRETGRANPEPTDIVFQGKFSCSLVRQVLMPFQGIIREVMVRCGQPVTEGKILARYQLAKEFIGPIRRRVSPPQINDLEMRLAEVERNLAVLRNKQREVRQLAVENMAPGLSLGQVEEELQLLGKQRSVIQEHLRQEKGAANDDIALLEQQLGQERIDANSIPAVGSLVARVSGHVIWEHPDLRNGAELPAGTQSFIIGVMDPMLLRAQVHEIEAMRLSVGDRAEISLESVPGRKVEGTITRISWASKAPGVEQPTFYEVELTVSNRDLSIRDGLKGEAVIRKTP